MHWGIKKENHVPIMLYYILLWEIVEQNAFRHICVWCTCLSVTHLSECEVPLSLTACSLILVNPMR